MIVSSSAGDIAARLDVVEVQPRNGLYYGLQLSDFAGPINESLQWFQVFRPTVLTSTPVTVPRNFMGLTVENVGNGNGLSTPPWELGIDYGMHRILAFGTYWPEIETSPGVYDWRKLDRAVELAHQAGKSVMWNVAYTPYFAGNLNYASDVNAHRSSGQANSGGWASAPGDLAATNQRPGSANSVVWSNFVRAAVQRYCGRITHYVMWNEPNYRRYATSGSQEVPHGNWFDTSDTGVLRDLTTVRTSVSGNQNYTQHVLLLADLYTIVHEEDPDATVIGPDFFGESPSQGTGGKQDGMTCFAAWLAAGGGNYCDAYGWHGYMDEYTGLDGVSKRLDSKCLTALDTARVAAGAPDLPRYNTETGHEELETMTLADQQLWLARHVITHAAKGYKSWVMYVWDSLNPSTTKMSLWAPPYLSNPGVRPIAYDFSRLSGLVSGATISTAARLNNGKVCATIGGKVYVDGVAYAL